MKVKPKPKPKIRCVMAAEPVPSYEDLPGQGIREAMKTLLIADDEPDLRLLLQTTLEDPAYRILEASDGESALHLVRQERPDVVILDRMMPKLGGLEVARAVLADPAIRHIPLILLTALEQPAAGDGEPAPKVFAYLVKPFSPLQLLETVRQALGQTSTP